MNTDPRLFRLAEVLVVEDNESDMILTQEGLEASRLAVNLHWVRNGRECMAFLRNEGDYADAPTPDVVLLDLNMPVMNGRDVLAELDEDAALREIPVIILTTSEAQRHLLDMYALRYSSYIVKPVDFDQFVRVVEELGNTWFTIVVLPESEA